MNKKIRIAVMCMVLAMVMVFCSCNRNKEDEIPKDATVVKVAVFNGGYGIKWLNEIASAYRVVNPNVYIKVEPYYSDSDARLALQSGESEIDLYFAKEFLYSSDNENVVWGSKRYNSYFADISSVWNTPAYGDTEPLSEKMVSEATAWFKNDKNVYRAIPWASAPCSVVINESVLKQCNLEVPVTSDEFISALETIKNANIKNAYGKDVYPLSISSEDDYSTYMLYNWFAQYNGVEGYENFWNGIDEQGNQYKSSVIVNEGILETLKAMEEMLSASNGYLHSSFLTDSFTESQFRLLEGEVGFGFNGDWLVSEMVANYTEEELQGIKMIKVPVISAIVNKLEDSTMSDATLSQIVKEVDAGAISSNKCSQNDFDIIKEARNTLTGLSNIHMAYIPIYAKHIEEAKDFLSFVYSDTGVELFAKNTAGCCLPVQYDYSNSDVEFIPFAKSVNKILSECNVLYQYNMKHRISAKNGLAILNGSEWTTFTQYFYASNPIDRKSAEDIYNGNILYVSSRWNTMYMQNIEE